MKYYANYKKLEDQILEFHRYIREHGVEEDENLWSYDEIFTSKDVRGNVSQYEISFPEYGWIVTLDYMENIYGHKHSVITTQGLNIDYFRMLMRKYIKV